MVAEMESVKVNVKPLADRVLVEAAPAEEKTSFGIIIPDTAKEKPQRGTVIAIGAGKKDEPLTVQVGDTVLYGKYAGTEITVEGKEYLIMRDPTFSQFFNLNEYCLMHDIQRGYRFDGA